MQANLTMIWANTQSESCKFMQIIWIGLIGHLCSLPWPHIELYFVTLNTWLKPFSQGHRIKQDLTVAVKRDGTRWITMIWSAPEPRACWPVAMRPSRVEQLVAEGHPRAKALQRAVTNLDTYFMATQLGITMASLALAGWESLPLLNLLSLPSTSFLRA